MALISGSLSWHTRPSGLPLLVCLAAHVEEFLEGLPKMSKLLLPPYKAEALPFCNR